MKAYVTSHVAGATLAQVASNPATAKQYENYLMKASSTGWDFEQVDQLPTGLLFLFSSTVAANQTKPSATLNG